MFLILRGLYSPAAHGQLLIFGLFWTVMAGSAAAAVSIKTKADVRLRRRARRNAPGRLTLAAIKTSVAPGPGSAHADSVQMLVAHSPFVKLTVARTRA